ncbi:MAG: PIN domain-containing protein [SAR202 cluster bacterium]|nr:PIN domain-containing protein [SAR202 cluster bacterium]
MQSNLFLLDTSVWLEVLPPRDTNPDLRIRVDALLAADQVATMGMVELELLGGVRSQQEWDRLQEYLSALHRLPVAEETWEEAAQMGFQLRRQGVTVPFTDLLIGAVAVKSDAILLHRDRHFDLMALHLPLHVESYITG